MIGDLLELVDLADKRDAYVQTLSRGMQQRLCLAHALVHDPQVLLLDEPASGLDPRARVELRELLRELRSLGKTILISSHILPELEELCTSVAIVDRGQVLAQGRVADIERRLRFGAVLRVRVLAEGDGARRPRATGSRPTRTSPRRRSSPTARSSSAFRGDDDGRGALLAARRGRRSADRDLRPRRERPRGAVPAGHGRRSRTGDAGMTDAADREPSTDAPTTRPTPDRRAPCRGRGAGRPIRRCAGRSAASRRSASRSCAAGCAAAARS